MTVIDGQCPSRDALDGDHRLKLNTHVAYYDCRGRIVDTDGGPHQANPRIFTAVANCELCLKPLVLFNPGWPTRVAWQIGGYLWRELHDEADLVDEYVISEEVVPCL